MYTKYTKLENDINEVVLSSIDDNDELNETVLQIINKFFEGKSFIFKASGLPHNIIDMLSDIESQSIQYYQGDSKKFFIKIYPECIALIDVLKINKILTMCWSNSITELRRIYIFDAKHTENLMRIFDEYKYSDSISNQKSWEYIDARIENIPECNSDSISIIFKDSYYKTLVDFLKSKGSPQHNQGTVNMKTEPEE